MKAFLSLCLLFAACLTTAWSATESAAPVTHPLKGVIMGILPEKSSLLVKHEEVPGVMRAMTMMFMVEPAVLEKVKRGDAITARMSRRDDGWWLTDVEIVPPATHPGVLLASRTPPLFIRNDAVGAGGRARPCARFGGQRSTRTGTCASTFRYRNFQS
ncbi:MAG TPA: copper-binding protein [Lacunisphaera sp.]